jgi:hypothetical protein
MTQSGFVGGDFPGTLGGRLPDINVGGGATWQHFAAQLQGDELNVGSGYGGGGTYSIGATVTFGTNTAGVNFNNINVGPLSDGTFVQLVGPVVAGGVTVGGSGGPGRGTPPPPGQRGYYIMSGGTLTAAGLVVGAKDALFGQFSQSGGSVNLGELIVNVNSTSTGIVNLSGGTFQAVSDSINNGTIAQSGGVMSINANLDGAGTVSVNGTGSFTVARLRQDAVMIGGNGQLAMRNSGIGTIGGGATSTSRVHSLSFEEIGNVVNGRWDLGKNRLVVDYSGASPADAIRRYLSSGATMGTGLFSRAAATDPTHSTALGYAESSAIFGASGGVFTDLFVDGTAILIKYTLYGDANFDTTVDTIDFNALAANFGGSGKQWTQGDFDCSGTVNTVDFNLLALTFSQSLPASGDFALVPEPGLSVAAFIVCLSARRARRLRHRGCMP